MKRIGNLLMLLGVWSFLISRMLWASAPLAMDAKITEIQNGWTQTKYVSETVRDRVDGYLSWAQKAHVLSIAYPNQAEPLIWEGLCYASLAEILKLKALSYAKKSRKLFLKAEQIDSSAINGAIYTNLGVLYHRVPGWPLGFGNVKQARDYFEKAIEAAPLDMDANYFYGLFLQDRKEYKQAKLMLEKALNAPLRNRPLADKMRKLEIQKALDTLK